MFIHPKRTLNFGIHVAESFIELASDGGLLCAANPVERPPSSERDLQKRLRIHGVFRVSERRL